MFTVLNLVSRVQGIGTQGWMESVLSLLEAGQRDLAAASARSRAPRADEAADEEGFVAGSSPAAGLS